MLNGVTAQNALVLPITLSQITYYLLRYLEPRNLICITSD